MFSWSRTFYAEKNGVYYNFDAKRQRDDAVKNHGMTGVTAAEAYKHYEKIVRVPWQKYENMMRKVEQDAGSKS